MIQLQVMHKKRKQRSDKIPEGYICDGPECTKLARRGNRLCPSHATQKSRHGEMWPLFSYRQRKETVGYSGAHRRVEKAKGKATDHDCVDCSGQAKQWSYDHGDPDELHEVYREYELPYSLDPDRYDPRCFECHKNFDQEKRVR